MQLSQTTLVLLATCLLASFAEAQVVGVEGDRADAAVPIAGESICCKRKREGTLVPRSFGVITRKCNTFACPAGYGSLSAQLQESTICTNGCNVDTCCTGGSAVLENAGLAPENSTPEVPDEFVMGSAGQSCTDVCTGRGQICNVDTTVTMIRDAWSAAGDVSAVVGIMERAGAVCPNGHNNEDYYSLPGVGNGNCEISNNYGTADGDVMFNCLGKFDTVERLCFCSAADFVAPPAGPAAQEPVAPAGDEPINVPEPEVLPEEPVSLDTFVLGTAGESCDEVCTGRGQLCNVEDTVAEIRQVWSNEGSATAVQTIMEAQGGVCPNGANNQDYYSLPGIGNGNCEISDNYGNGGDVMFNCAGKFDTVQRLCFCNGGEPVVEAPAVEPPTEEEPIIEAPAVEEPVVETPNSNDEFVLGAAGESCDDVCTGRGQLCNVEDTVSQIRTVAGNDINAVVSLIESEGGVCPNGHNNEDYYSLPGVGSGNCEVSLNYINGGDVMFNCAGKFDTVERLCYCNGGAPEVQVEPPVVEEPVVEEPVVEEPAVEAPNSNDEFVLGAAGESCDDVCTGRGQLCNVEDTVSQIRAVAGNDINAVVSLIESEGGVCPNGHNNEDYYSLPGVGSGNCEVSLNYINGGDVMFNCAGKFDTVERLCYCNGGAPEVQVEPPVVEEPVVEEPVVEEPVVEEPAVEAPNSNDEFIMGAAGQSCDDVCTGRGQLCNVEDTVSQIRSVAGDDVNAVVSLIQSKGGVCPNGHNNEDYYSLPGVGSGNCEVSLNYVNGGDVMFNCAGKFDTVERLCFCNGGEVTVPAVEEPVVEEPVVVPEPEVPIEEPELPEEQPTVVVDNEFVMGAAGSSCDEVCDSRGQLCNVDNTVNMLRSSWALGGGADAIVALITNNGGVCPNGHNNEDYYSLPGVGSGNCEVSNNYGNGGDVMFNCAGKFDTVERLCFCNNADYGNTAPVEEVVQPGLPEVEEPVVEVEPPVVEEPVVEVEPPVVEEPAVEPTADNEFVMGNAGQSCEEVCSGRSQLCNVDTTVSMLRDLWTSSGDSSGIVSVMEANGGVCPNGANNQDYYSLPGIGNGNCEISNNYGTPDGEVMFNCLGKFDTVERLCFCSDAGFVAAPAVVEEPEVDPGFVLGDAGQNCDEVCLGEGKTCNVDQTVSKLREAWTNGGGAVGIQSIMEEQGGTCANGANNQDYYSLPGIGNGNCEISNNYGTENGSVMFNCAGKFNTVQRLCYCQLE